MTAPAIPTTEPEPLVLADEGYQRLVLSTVDWAAYEAIGEALRDRPNLRLTYDRGELEVVTLSTEHERIKVLLGRLVDVLAEEANVRIGGFGSTTYKLDALTRGLEPDQCYYLANFDRVRLLKRIDLATDPPPDLAIEVDIASASSDRMSIYARIGVPEVWRLLRSGVLRAYTLTAGAYAGSDVNSTFLPDFPVNELVRFLHVGRADGDTAMVRAFRTWLQQYIADRGLTS